MPASRAPRVLIVSADIGAGHDLPARLLAEGLRERCPAAEVTVVDGVGETGPVVRGLVRRGQELLLQHARAVFDLQYWLVSRWAPSVRLTTWLGMRLAAPAMERLAARMRPDVIVSTYPGSTELFGNLRRAGRVRAPVVSAVTDLAGLRYWANPGVDLHLVIHAESAAEVREIAGPGARIAHVRGLSRAEFERPPAPAEARAALGLPPEGPVVLVSGGGWGIGDLVEAARVALAVPGATVVCLCGSSRGAQRRIEAALGGEPRLRVEGFTDRMATWMAAADVLVHSTAGLTMLEAQMAGIRAISYGWGIAHVRLNNRAYERFGLADVATTPGELAAALRAALAAPRAPDPSFAALPAAADAVLELAGAA